MNGVIPTSTRRWRARGACRSTRCGRRVLESAPRVPTPTWGRDELGTGEMWNSNSLISWLIVCSGPLEDARLPAWGALPAGGPDRGCSARPVSLRLRCVRGPAYTPSAMPIYACVHGMRVPLEELVGMTAPDPPCAPTAALAGRAAAFRVRGSRCCWHRRAVRLQPRVPGAAVAAVGPVAAAEPEVRAVGLRSRRTPPRRRPARAAARAGQDTGRLRSRRRGRRPLVRRRGPGFHEDKQGYPFVGSAGKLLDRIAGRHRPDAKGRVHRERVLVVRPATAIRSPTRSRPARPTSSASSS